MVREFDHVRPRTLDTYLEFLQMSEKEFEAALEDMRDPAIWERDARGCWRVRDSVVNHIDDPKVAAACPPESDDRTLSLKNRHLFYVPPSLGGEPCQSGHPAPDEAQVGSHYQNFVVL